MHHFQTALSSTPATSPHPEKSGLLTLPQIAQLIAQAIEQERQDLVQAHSSHLYATDRDEFLDLHAHQSVNANPANYSNSQA